MCDIFDRITPANVRSLVEAWQFRTGDLDIPNRYGAEYVIVDGLLSKLRLALPVVYQDGRFTLYSIPHL